MFGVLLNFIHREPIREHSVAQIQFVRLLNLDTDVEMLSGGFECRTLLEFVQTVFGNFSNHLEKQVLLRYHLQTASENEGFKF